MSSVPATRPSLLLRMRNPGDDDSWRTFVDVYGPLIYHYCLTKGLQDADAAEVMQEVLLEVSRAIGKFDYEPERGHFRSWLGTVTHSKLCRFWNRTRANRIARSVDEAALVDRAVASRQENQWTESFNRHLLATSLIRIRPRFEEATWQAFVMVWIEDRGAADVARQLDRSVNWVYVAKSRVLSQLQREVSELAKDAVHHAI